MRIVFLAWRDLAHPHAGGSEYVVDRLARGLTGLQHDVTLLAGAPVAPREYSVVDTGGRFSQYVRAPFTARSAVRHADVVVDVENGIPFFSPLWHRGPVVCLVHHVHTEQWDLYFPWPAARVGNFLEHRAMPAAYRNSQFVAVSPSTAQELARIGVDRTRTHTITMGCDPAPRQRPTSPTPVFLSVGRLVPHKRIDLLLELWEQVRPRTGGTLVIAGDGPERAALERMAGDQVVFRGFVSEPDKAALLDEAWLLVHPAMHEGWGTVIMEAAAHGLPTVAFDVVGVRDSIRQHESGALSATSSEFVAMWTTLASDHEPRTRLAAGALAWSLEHTWERAIGDFEAVLATAVHAAK